MFALLLFGLTPWSLTDTLPALADHGTAYVEAWTQFYPSEALTRGLHRAIFYQEDRSAENIKDWINYNKNLLALLPDKSSPYAYAKPIDARLLRLQARSEIDHWQGEAPQHHSLSMYSGLIAGAAKKLMEAEFLLAAELPELVRQNLRAAQGWCVAAKASLRAVDRQDLEDGLKQLAAAEHYYRLELPPTLNERISLSASNDLHQQSRLLADSIQSLTGWIQARLRPGAKLTDPVLGRSQYTNKLAWYTDRDLTPDELARLALKEIEEVKGLMAEVARSYLQQSYPQRALPKDRKTIISAALLDMEKDAPASGAEYIQFWQQLSDSAAAFVKTHRIATLPKHETLRILPAPESAGPAARIGWVSSAPPFAPNPLTTLYLPSIPDTLPRIEQEQFWASFNKPFNRIIVIHELYPGHYMQNKIARESPHPLRLLFPYGPYSEGWATFCEKVLLDAGWERDRPLTLLAHLRKRLENANRAYTSVQVHCNGWTQEQVLRFSTEIALLAPQFAKSLWGRLLRAPLQMTSYFWGGRQFSELLASEQKRRGDQFDLMEFMDTILRAGPIPIDEFPAIFGQSIPKR